MNSRIAILAVVLGLTTSVVFTRDLPPEPPRVKQSTLTTLYLPSFGILQNSVLPLYDNFSAEGSFVNLIQKGPNLNFYYGFSHRVLDYPVFPVNRQEMETLLQYQQVRDRFYGKVNYAFLDFFQVNLELDYTENRMAQKPALYQDYTYNRTALSLDVGYDARYSAIEEYYKGKEFIYPQEGLKTSLGLRSLWYQSVLGGNSAQNFVLYGGIQYLINVQRFWVFSLNVSGETHLSPTSNRTQLITSRVIGAYEFPGNYNLDADLEVRYLFPGGAFWESPAFWYINSFLFKFSPGFLVGYNAGYTGDYSGLTGLSSFQNSLYFGPMVAIRMNGVLQSVLQLDFSIANSGNYQFVLVLSFGTAIGNKPDSLLRYNQR